MASILGLRSVIRYFLREYHTSVSLAGVSVIILCLPMPYEMLSEKWRDRTWRNRLKRYLDQDTKHILSNLSSKLSTQSQACNSSATLAVFFYNSSYIKSINKHTMTPVRTREIQRTSFLWPIMLDLPT